MERTLVITGGGRGLGAHAVERLRRDHPELHLLLLTREECDLTSPEEVRGAARRGDERVGSGEIPPLHGFLGNAGVQLTRADTATVDGARPPSPSTCSRTTCCSPNWSSPRPAGS